MNSNLLDMIIGGRLSEEEIADICRRALEVREVKETLGVDTETEDREIILSIYAMWLYEGNTAEDFRVQRMITNLNDFRDEVTDSKMTFIAIEERLCRCEELYREYLIYKNVSSIRASYEMLNRLIDIVDYTALREMEMCRSNGPILRLVEMRRDMDKIGNVMKILAHG